MVNENSVKDFPIHPKGNFHAFTHERRMERKASVENWRILHCFSLDFRGFTAKLDFASFVFVELKWLDEYFHYYHMNL